MYSGLAATFNDSDNTVIITMPPLIFESLNSSSIISDEKWNGTIDYVTESALPTASTKVANFDYTTEIVRNFSMSKHDFTMELVTDFTTSLSTNNTDFDMNNATANFMRNFTAPTFEIEQRKVEANSVILYGVLPLVFISLLYVCFLIYYIRQRYHRRNSWRTRQDVTEMCA